jgi:hypothetical protein
MHHLYHGRAAARRPANLINTTSLEGTSVAAQVHDREGLMALSRH